MPSVIPAGYVYWDRFGYVRESDKTGPYSVDSSGTATLIGDGAVLDLNFLTGVLDNRITFTRAGSATFVGSDGLIQTAGTDVARFDHDPVSLAARGLLMEEARTNLQRQSADATQWNGGPGTGVTVALDADGLGGASNTASTLTATAGNSQHFLPSGVLTSAFVSGVTYSQTVYIEPGTVSRAQLTYTTPSGTFDAANCANFSLSGAGSVLHTAGSGVTAAVVRAANGFYACTITAPCLVSNTGSSCIVAFINSDTAARLPTFVAAGTETMLVGAGQIEAGANATSYIPTAGSSVLRATDSALLSGTGFSDFYNVTEGSIVAEVILPRPLNGSQTYVSIDSGAGNRIQLQAVTAASTTCGIEAASVGQFFDAYAATANLGALNKSAVGYSVGSVYVATNGVQRRNTLSGITIPTAVNRLSIGMDRIGAAKLNGHIQRIRYWNKRLSNAQLQALTA